jgi:NAD(P)-dependent dehydrogenase (short-subunit alcohol dehydrogenase family)
VNSALANKVSVIVGGTAGLGLSGAKACAGVGAKVIIVGRDGGGGAGGDWELGDAARAVVGDATDPQTAEKAIAAAVEAFGDWIGCITWPGGRTRRGMGRCMRSGHGSFCNERGRLNA